MVLCRFFLQGTCRFGSKCHNEHVDIKQIVKTDMEGALNGKQWPFSCYGPFKDAICIPNFIEDQSFEEIRLLSYESKQKNCFEQFDQQFKKEAFEVNQKMKMLIQFSPEVFDVICNIYNRTVEANVANATGAKVSNANPFGTLGSGVAGNAGVSGTSLFAKPAGNPSGNSIFGGGNSGGFGGAVSANAPSAGSIFGGSSTATPSNSIFGNAPANPFGQPASTAPTSIFAKATSAGPFFGAAGSTPMATSNSGNIFAQAANNQTGNGTFGMQPAQTSIFANNQQTQQPAANIFSQTSNPFQQQQQQMTSAANPFGATTTANQPGGQGIFGHTTSVNNNVFMQQQQQQHQQQSLAPAATGGHIFAEAMQQISAAARSSVTSTAYSRMEDLTTEEIEAFKADCFQQDKIPFNPPPKELIH